MHPAFRPPGGGRLRWAHAANSELQLRAALADRSVDAVEADVCTLPSGGDGRKVCIAHPPAVNADMTAERFVDIVGQSDTRKIIKLDFKCDDVIAEVVDLVLRSGLADVTPLVLNADVIACSETPPPVSSEILLSQHARLQSCLIPPVISLGWCPPSGRDVSLTSHHLSEMAALARNRPATLALRADVALALERGLIDLLGGLPGCGLTLWAHPGDPVCPEVLRGMVQRLGAVPVWVDVPEAMFPDCRMSA